MEQTLESLKDKMDPLPAGKYLVGLSGGADSVALLLMTAEMAKGNLEAIHVNHGLRGNESDADEAFVKALCAQQNISLHIYHPDLRGRKDENTAREARYWCFRECMRETGADYLLLAHHADDLAETFMMRLLRGAGPEGLGCMKGEDKVFGIRILRPMLRLNRGVIRETLKAEGIPWREDESNRNPSYFRNDVRIRLMPLMEEMSPGASSRIAAAAARIAADNETLDKEVRVLLERYAGKRWIDPRAIFPLSRGQQCRVLRQWWRDNAPRMKEHELSAEQTERLLKLSLSQSGKINMPGGLFAVKGKQALHLTGFHDEPIRETAVGGEVTAFGDFSLIIVSGEGNPGDGRTTQEVPSGWIKGCVIRSRKPGDRIIPFGMTGSRKLQDYLTDRGIDEPWRDRIPLLCRGNEVLMAAGVGAGNIPIWNREQESVRLKWCGDMPWCR